MTTTTYILDFVLPLLLLLTWLVWDIVVNFLYWNVTWKKPGDWPTITGIIRKTVLQYPEFAFVAGLVLGGLMVHFFLDIY